jgi:hypothetical protein
MVEFLYTAVFGVLAMNVLVVVLAVAYATRPQDPNE